MADQEVHGYLITDLNPGQRFGRTEPPESRVTTGPPLDLYLRNPLRWRVQRLVIHPDDRFPKPGDER